MKTTIKMDQIVDHDGSVTSIVLGTIAGTIMAIDWTALGEEINIYKIVAVIVAGVLGGFCGMAGKALWKRITRKKGKDKDVGK